MTEQELHNEYRKSDCKSFTDFLINKIAELKGIKDVATLIRANNDTVVTLMQLNNKLVSKSQQLTKAIELLKETQGYIENIDDILYDEIEQFIREIEKWHN